MAQRSRPVLDYSSVAQEQRRERELLEQQRERWRALRMFPFGDGQWAATTRMVSAACLVLGLLAVCMLPRPWGRIAGALLGLCIAGWVWYRLWRRYRERFPW